jgi:hypothetical protein
MARPLRQEYAGALYHITQAFNQKHSRAGHLFQKRYRAILLEKHNYLLQLPR